MKLVEKYIVAVSGRLPLKTRAEVVNELRSLLLDEIEERFGPEPDNLDVKKYLKEFGSPTDTAARYAGENFAIAPALTDIYYLISKIMLGAVTIAFTVIFILRLFDTPLVGADLFWGIVQIPLNAFGTWVAGFGFLTLLCIFVSWVFRQKEYKPNQEWDPADLDDIEVTEHIESKAEGFVSIGFSFILIVLMLSYPQVITFAEDSFELSGIMLGHRIELDVFISYIPILIILWCFEISLKFLLIKQGFKSIQHHVGEVLLHIIGIVVFALFLTNEGLWNMVGTGTGGITDWLGFKTIFLIVLLVSVGELLASIVRVGKNLYKQGLFSIPDSGQNKN